MSVPGLDRDSAQALAMIEAAAANADRCPSNKILAAALGRASTSRGAAAVERLERLGLIKVERFQHARRVTIVATGKATKEIVKAEARPHWRLRYAEEPAAVARERAVTATMPQVAVIAGRLLTPELIKSIEAEAARLKMATSVLSARLLWLGWHCHLEAEGRAPGDTGEGELSGGES